MRTQHSSVGSRWIDEEIPNWRWNYKASLFEGTLAIIASSLVSPMTVLPSYVKELADRIPGASSYENSLVSAIYVIFTAIPLLVQLFALPLIERRPLRKPVVVFFCWACRLPWVPLVLAAVFWSAQRPLWALAATFGCALVISIASGGVAPAWSDLISRLIPARQRGPLFAARMVCSGVLAIVGLFVIPWALHGSHFPETYTVLFALAFFLNTGSTIGVQLHREPPATAVRHSGGVGTLFQDALAILVRDVNFRRLCLAGVPLGFSTLVSVPVLTVTAINTLGVPTSRVAALSAELTVAYLVAQTLSSYLSGAVWTGKSFKIPFAASFCCTPIAALMAAVAQTRWQFDLALAVAGFGNGLAATTTLLFVLELAPGERRASYVALRNVTSGPCALAPLLGGWLIDAAGYRVTLVLAWVALLVGLYSVAGVRSSAVGRESSAISSSPGVT